MTNKGPLSQHLPQHPVSMWRDTTPLPSFPRLAEDHETDIAVIGGGITGITAAYLLQKEGYKVTLLEGRELFMGATGFTTAKVTAQHGVIYDDLLRHFGEEQARQYYESNAKAMEWVAKAAEEHGIDCGLTRETAYVYADEGDDKTLSKLQDEFKAYEKLGIPGTWESDLPLPLPVSGAIALPGQLRFHPLHYLKALLKAFVDGGGTVYEHTMIGEEVEGDGPLTLFTERGKHRIRCRHAVSASHFPFYDGGSLYFARLHPERSYCLAVEPETAFEGGMYISASEPKRSLRAVEWEGKRLVLVGGANHKTGQGICTIRYYEELEMFAGDLLGIRSMPYRWSTQDLITVDKVPYIGRMSGDKEIYVATGFAKWGMSNGTLAALMITDQITGRGTPYADLYSPSRFKAVPGVKEFVAQNANVAKELIAGKLESVQRKADDLAPGEGAVIRYDGDKVGAYRDPGGKLHLVDRTCTHMGCECDWNEAERSWDCPCHGSRFSFDGSVLEGPATQPLKKLKEEEA